MINRLLDKDIQDFISSHISTDVSRLALLKNPFPDVEFREILNQYAAKSKSRTKLPTWFETDGIYFPPKISIEQTSSEITAAYKASLVSGQSLIDLSGGFGVDGFYFARSVQRVVHCEINEELSRIAAYNFGKLGTMNVACKAGDGTKILSEGGSKFDWIYVDPSRRSDVKGKVFLLSDCLPDVPQLLGLYMEHSDNIMVKTAPLLDISAGLSQLRNVREIHIVAVENEVKELLWIIKKGFEGQPEKVAVNLTGKRQLVRFNFSEEKQPVRYELLQTYLYEPNAALMKSGEFAAIGAKFNIGKLHLHSHLYTSDALLPDFPGRIFTIEKVIPYRPTEMKAELSGKKANVTTRNFPENVETLRKKWKIADGGDRYCFFTTDADNRKIVLLCAKI